MRAGRDLEDVAGQQRALPPAPSAQCSTVPPAKWPPSRSSVAPGAISSAVALPEPDRRVGAHHPLRGRPRAGGSAPRRPPPSPASPCSSAGARPRSRRARRAPARAPRWRRRGARCSPRARCRPGSRSRNARWLIAKAGTVWTLRSPARAGARRCGARPPAPRARSRPARRAARTGARRRRSGSASGGAVGLGERGAAGAAEEDRHRRSLLAALWALAGACRGRD